MPRGVSFSGIYCQQCERGLSHSKWRWHRHNPHRLNGPATLVWPLSTALPFGLRNVRRAPAIFRKLVLVVLIALVVFYTVTIFVHLSNGFSFGQSLDMGIRDIRVLATCPHKPGVVWRWMDRGVLESYAAGWGQLTGQVPSGQRFYQAICASGARQ